MPIVVQTEFNATCTPVQYPCKTGSRYVDPCDCSSYFLCRDATTIIQQSCSEGTAYDHNTTTTFCRYVADVILEGLCDQEEPWERCEDHHPNADLDKLEAWCTGTGYSTPSPTPQPQDVDDDSNAGTIAAVVISLLLIIVVVVVIVIYVRKKGNPIKHIKQYIQREGSTRNDSNSQQADSRYIDTPASAPPYDEEIYTEITDDPVMYHDPGSDRGKSSLKQTTSFDNEAYDREPASVIGQTSATWGAEEEVAYDNPALRLDRDTPRPAGSAPPAYSPPSSTSASAKLQHRADLGGGAVEMHRLKLNAHPASVQPSVDEEGYLVASSQAGSFHEPLYHRKDHASPDRSVND